MFVVGVVGDGDAAAADVAAVASQGTVAVVA